MHRLILTRTQVQQMRRVVLPQPQKRDISEWFLAKIPKGMEGLN